MVYYIKQNDSKGCGVACLNMLLANIYNKKDYLYLFFNKNNDSVSLLEIINEAHKYGVILKAYKAIDMDDEIEKIKLPFLVVMNIDSVKHMVLIKKIKKKKILIYDPDYGIYWMPKKEFYIYWSGEFLEIDKILGNDIKIKSKSLYDLKYYIVPLLFQILSFSTIFIGILFIDKMQFFYLILSFIFLYFIFDYLYKKSVIHNIKKFDDNLIDNGNNSIGKIRKNNELINKVKTKCLSFPIEIFSSSAIIFFSIFIMGLNSFVNIISIVLLIIFNICLRMIDFKKINYIKRSISIEERELLNIENESKENYKSKLHSLNDKASKLALYLNLKKYFILFFIISFNILYMYLNNSLSLNFILFYFFSYMFINDNAEKLISLIGNINEYKRLKQLYLYTFD